MSTREARTPDAEVATADTAAGARQVPLQHGRRLALTVSGGDDLVEVRGAGGALELRIRMTAEGPVLQMESLRLSLKAAQDVEVECANFAVRAREEMTLQTDGALRIQGEADLHVDAGGEVHVRGTVIHLN